MSLPRAKGAGRVDASRYSAVLSTESRRRCVVLTWNVLVSVAAGRKPAGLLPTDLFPRAPCAVTSGELRPVGSDRASLENERLVRTRSRKHCPPPEAS